MTARPTPVLLLALSALVAGPALAQTVPAPQSRSLAPGGAAAATLPNTFDGPASPRAATRAPVPPAPPVQVTEVQMAEAALRAIIGQIQAGDLDEALFTPDLAKRLNGELETLTPMVLGYGPVESVEAQGAPAGVGQFLVTFESAATQWRVGLEEGGLVAALLFREVPAESSEPGPAAD